MNDQLRGIIELQDKDLFVDRLTEEIEHIPVAIEQLNAAIELGKKKIDDFRKENNQNLLTRKQKEGDLQQKEQEIDKHNKELNSVKTNEAYRAILKEIEKVKLEKNAVEEEILDLMERIDTFSKEVKKVEQDAKLRESELQKQIAGLQESLKVKTAEREIKTAERDEAAKLVSGELMAIYKNIRKAKSGSAIVELKEGTCGGCRMRVPPHILNQVMMGHELVVCEVCSRILYMHQPQNNVKT